MKELQDSQINFNTSIKLIGGRIKRKINKSQAQKLTKLASVLLVIGTGIGWYRDDSFLNLAFFLFFLILIVIVFSKSAN